MKMGELRSTIRESVVDNKRKQEMEVSLDGAPDGWPRANLIYDWIVSGGLGRDDFQSWCAHEFE